jgi:hypothetical protein
MIIGMCGLANSGKDTAAQYIVTDHSFVPIAFADEMKRICKRIYLFTDEQLWGPSEMRNAIDKRYPRAGHTWVSLPRRERKPNAEEGAKWGPDVTKIVEHDWYGCACCSREIRATRSEDDDSSFLIDTEPCYLTPRYALQQLGTGWGRDCWGDTWVAVTLRDARLLLGMDKSDAVSGYWYDRKLGLQDNFKTKRIPNFVPGVILTDVRYLNEIRAIKAVGGKVVRVRRPGAGLQGGAGQHSSETEQASIPDSEFDAVIINDESLDALHSKVHHTAVNVLGMT